MELITSARVVLYNFFTQRTCFQITNEYSCNHLWRDGRTTRAKSKRDYNMYKLVDEYSSKRRIKHFIKHQ